MINLSPYLFYKGLRDLFVHAGNRTDYLDHMTPQACFTPTKEMLWFRVILADTGSAQTHSLYMFLLFNICAFSLVTFSRRGLL